MDSTYSRSHRIKQASYNAVPLGIIGGVAVGSAVGLSRNTHVLPSMGKGAAVGAALGLGAAALTGSMPERESFAKVLWGGILAVGAGGAIAGGVIGARSAQASRVAASLGGGVVGGLAGLGAGTLIGAGLSGLHDEI